MATVHFSSALTPYTGGIETVDIDAPRVRELILAIIKRFPTVAEPLERMAVAIDGEIYNNDTAAYHRLARDTTVHFVPPVAGG